MENFKRKLPKPRTPDRQVDSTLRWMGALAGASAAAIALGFGQFIEGATDIPGLVLGVGELVIDYTPGRVAEESIENLGSSGKGNLLPGITVVALAFAAVIGDIAARRGNRIGIYGFLGFGLLGGFATARNPQSPAVASWFWSLVACGLGVATLIFLLNWARGVAASTDEANNELPNPLNPPHSRRSFIGWSAGAGAVALTSVGVGRAVSGPSAAELAREGITLPSPSSTTSAAPTDASITATGDVATAPFEGIDGLSSWITPSTDDQFYRIDTALSVPQVDPADWSLKITGLVDNPLEISYDELLKTDLAEHTITLSCVSNEVGGNLVGNATWTGIPVVDLLERAGVQPEATQLVGRSVDDFTAGFPTELLYDGRNALLAIGMNGEALPIRHGFPARLVIAGLYGYVSATKWIEEIQLTRLEDFNGYWINLGWSKDGPMKTTSRIDVPRRRDRIAPGPTPIAGVAWAPTRGIGAVEISIDDGAWQECDLAVPGSDETWVQWQTEWDAPVGSHSIQVRAFDGNGALQPIGPKSVAPDGAEGWHAVQVKVS